MGLVIAQSEYSVLVVSLAERLMFLYILCPYWYK